MEETKQPTEQYNKVAIIENSLDLLKTGPAVLTSNKARKDKAIIVGNKILDEIAAGGMTPELDERAKNYLLNITKAGKEIKADREGITQIMDSLRSLFTEIENEIDPKKPDTVPSRVQLKRNEYAAQQMKITEEKRRQAEEAERKEKARIKLKADMATLLSNYFHSYLLSQKTKFTAKFNGLVLDSFADDAAAIRAYQPGYKIEHFNNFPVACHVEILNIVPAGFNREEVEEIGNACLITEQYELFASQYISEMKDLKNEIVEKLPSKRNELQQQRDLEIQAAEERRKNEEAERKRQAEINAANEKEKERLQKIADEEKQNAAEREEELERQRKKSAEERQQRENEEQEKLQQQTLENQNKALQEIELAKQGEQTMAMFEKENTLAETVPVPKVKEGYKITVLHAAGYVQLFTLWFEAVGKNLPLDKLGNTKLDQMKAWAEKDAMKPTGTKIEGKFIVYEETYKATNR